MPTRRTCGEKAAIEALVATKIAKIKAPTKKSVDKGQLTNEWVSFLVFSTVAFLWLLILLFAEFATVQNGDQYGLEKDGQRPAGRQRQEGWRRGGTVMDSKLDNNRETTGKRPKTLRDHRSWGTKRHCEYGNTGRRCRSPTST